MFKKKSAVYLLFYLFIYIGPSILNLDIKQLSSNKAVLQSLINFSCNAIQDKHFPNSSELMERFKFLKDQLPIVITDGIVTKAVDTALNLKLYDLLCEQKIGQIVDMFLEISLNNYAEMNKFMYNLALCIMEQRQDDVSISLSTFLQNMSCFNLKNPLVVSRKDFS